MKNFTEIKTDALPFTKERIMKITKIFIVLFLAVISVGFMTNDMRSTTSLSEKTDAVLRHVVLFKFKDGAALDKIKIVEDAFNALPSKIPQIMSYEWGINNSPEEVDKGFTHCYFLTFASEEDRAIYLPHPDHKAFGATLDGILDDVLVVDYWTK